MARELNDEIISWRRDFHMHPELGYHERRTAGIVAENLRKWGYRVITGVAETGVIGVLRGAEGDKTIALRADMDALPLNEENDVPYRSKVKGVMHACGHDAHVAMLLGAAKILAKIKDELKGNVKLIFQPAEEGGNGAERMIKEGALDDPKVDMIYGLHVWSQIESGRVGIKEGPLLAATGSFSIEVYGKGGHGAYPHQAVDPIVVASSIVVALQSIVSRNVDPIDSAVVSVCTFRAGKAFNVIPDKAFMAGTYRALRKETLNLVVRRIREIADHISRAYGATCDVQTRDITPPTINHPEATKIAKEVAMSIVGEGNILIPSVSMGGEDFAFYLERVPGAFILLGTGNSEKGTMNPHHSPHFDVDEDVLYIGSALYAGLAHAYLTT